MGSRPQGLGKGLDALFNQAKPNHENQPSSRYQSLRLDQIEANPVQPRKNFDQQCLQELARSIESQGILQPIMVRPIEDNEDKYQIVAGERRWRACLLTDLKYIPAIISNLSYWETLLIGLIENLHREDLNPIDESEALATLHNEFGISQEDIAQKIGKSRSSIANSLRLQNLEPEIKEGLREEKISAGQARTLLGIDDSKMRIEVFRLVLDKDLTVREVERIVSFWKKHQTLPSLYQKNNDRNQISEQEKKSFENFKRQIQKMIASKLETKVSIKGAYDKGHISLKYNSQNEFNSLLNKLGIELE